MSTPPSRPSRPVRLPSSLAPSPSIPTSPRTPPSRARTASPVAPTLPALPLRPALADVLAVLTDTLPAQWSPESYRVTAVTWRWVGRRHPPQGMGVDGGVPLAMTDPAEAFEAITVRGVLPDSWAVDVRRGWVCAMCGGDGNGNAPLSGACVPCRGFGHVAHPPTIPALVAWASLGPTAILRAEELAREAVRQLRQWGAPQVERVVWRVGLRVGPRSGLNPYLIDPTRALWDEGLAIDSITADAVTIVVPPIGGAS